MKLDLLLSLRTLELKFLGHVIRNGNFVILCFSQGLSLERAQADVRERRFYNSFVLFPSTFVEKPECLEFPKAAISATGKMLKGLLEQARCLKKKMKCFTEVC